MNRGAKRVADTHLEIPFSDTTSRAELCRRRYETSCNPSDIVRVIKDL